MAASYYFYDLETSGVNPRTARIMQFAGQRTDMNLQPIGEPHNILIKLSDDILPEPDAIMITGITPQQTIADGITEAEFIKLFDAEINTPDTVFLGFNSVRFDDEFMRFTMYRNFYDPYEWQWKDGRSRWDMLDVVRMTRALRPDGINWPFASDGKPTNRLELLTSLNKLDHSNAHDALSDVNATIAVARMIRDKQPKLYDYLLEMRNKKKVEALVQGGQPFVYVSGKYSASYEKLAVVTTLGEHPGHKGYLVYDLRHDPSQFIDMSAEELAKIWRWSKDPEALRLPVKALQLNRCPAVAPLGVLNDENKTRLKLDLARCMAHKKLLDAAPEFIGKLHAAVQMLDNERADQGALFVSDKEVDSQLYDGFIADGDKKHMPEIRNAAADHLDSFAKQLKDERLQALLPLYKARNFPGALSSDEREAWDAFRTIRLQKSLPGFAARLQSIATRDGVTQAQVYLVEELQLYAESIMPASD